MRLQITAKPVSVPNAQGVALPNNHWLARDGWLYNSLKLSEGAYSELSWNQRREPPWKQRRELLALWL